MPRRPLGDRPQTAAQRQAALRARKAEAAAALRQNLERIATARTVKEAREIARAILGEMQP